MGKFAKDNYRLMFDWAYKVIDDPVLKFVSLWIVFNHWYRVKYEKEKLSLSDRQCLEKIKQDYTFYQHIFRGNPPPSKIKNLFNIVSLSKVLGFKSIPKLMIDNYHFVKDQENFKTLIELIYEVRNAIFHGEVSINNANLRELVEQINIFFGYELKKAILNPHLTN